MYPIVIFDALRVKIRDADSRMVKNKAVYIALGVTREGEREVLGLWIADNEGAKFWLSVMNELRHRGVRHPDRRCRRAEGLSRGDHRRLPRDHGPDLLGRTAPNRHRCARMRSLQISSEGDRPWNTGYPHRNGHVKARLSVAWRRRY